MAQGYIPPIQGYSILNSFVSGFASGAQTMMDLRKKAADLELSQIKRERERATLEYDKRIRDRIEQQYNQPLGDADYAAIEDSLREDGTTDQRGRGGGGVGAWGSYADEAIDELRKLGWTEAAIQGAMANGLAEGGFSDPWKKAGGGENSFGHWQLNQKGELPNYLANEGAGGDRGTRAQARFLARRMEELHPGFGQLSDPREATDIILNKFERPANRAPRTAALDAAQNYMGRATSTQVAEALPEVGGGRATQLTGEAPALLPRAPSAPVIGPSGLRPPPMTRSDYEGGAVPPTISRNSRGEPYNLANQPGQRVSAGAIGAPQLRDLARAQTGTGQPYIPPGYAIVPAPAPVIGPQSFVIPVDPRNTGLYPVG